MRQPTVLHPLAFPGGTPSFWATCGPQSSGLGHRATPTKRPASPGEQLPLRFPHQPGGAGSGSWAARARGKEHNERAALGAPRSAVRAGVLSSGDSVTRGPLLRSVSGASPPGARGDLPGAPGTNEASMDPSRGLTSAERGDAAGLLAGPKTPVPGSPEFGATLQVHVVSYKRFIFILNTEHDAQTGGTGPRGPEWRRGPGAAARPIPPGSGPRGPAAAAQGRSGQGGRCRWAAPHLPARPRHALPSSVRPSAPPRAGPPPAPRRGRPAGRRGLHGGGWRGSTGSGAAPSSPPSADPRAGRAPTARPAPRPSPRPGRTDRDAAPCYLPEGSGRWPRVLAPVPSSPPVGTNHPRLPREAPATTPTVFGGLVPPPP